MTFNDDLENLPSARKLTKVAKFADDVYEATFNAERRGALSDRKRMELLFLAGQKRGEWQMLRDKSRTARPSSTLLRKIAALKAESQELCARAGFEGPEWPE